MEYNSSVYLRVSNEPYMLCNYMEDSKITMFWNKKMCQDLDRSGIVGGNLCSLE